MTSAPALLRSLMVYAICVPLAITIGYMMASPFDVASLTTLGLVSFLLLTPILLRWHHIWLFATWNTTMVLFFVKGKPAAWLALSVISLGIALLQYILNRRMKFIHVPSVSRPLIFLVLVVLITAWCTGGIGLSVFGSGIEGGKRYIYLLGSILGYFALISQPIPRNRVWLYVGLFFLSGISTAISELAFAVSPAFYFIFLLFPVSGSGLKAVVQGTGLGPFARLEGCATAGSFAFYWMLCRYGIADLFTLRRLGRLLLFIGFTLFALLGGYRGTMVTFILTFVILFYLEGLLRSRLLPIFLFLAIALAALSIPLASRLPFSIQRALSVVPGIPVSDMARESGQGSSEWRIAMWKHVVTQVPDYLLLGKGYSFNATDLDMAQMNAVRGTGQEGSELVGDYHNGPLSVIIPFGLFGAAAFLWFLAASFKVLRQNARFGDPEVQRINTFLLAYFCVKVIFFFAVFGALSSDIAAFAGLLGLSVSVNGGVAKPAVVPEPKVVFNRFRLHPGARPPLPAH